MRRLMGLVTAAALMTTVVVIGSSPSSVSAATPIAGFTDDQIGSRPDATAIEWLPDDRIVVLQQSGVLSITRPGQNGFVTALTMSGICSNNERGLLGFTHDPAFLSNRFVYIYYTRVASGAPGGCVNRVSRFTLADDTIVASSEVVLLDNISSVAGNHNGGDIDFGPDGFLYVAVGDAGSDPRGGGGTNDASQDLSLLNGKILRVTSAGEPAPGNPISGPDTARCATRGNTPSTPTTMCQEIYAWGLRNPYRFAFNRGTGATHFFINDVGQSTFEEVNLGAAGANYGWPVREGLCQRGATPPCDPTPSQYTDPLTAYGRDIGTYITAGAFVPEGLWPAQYDSAYLFADGGSGNIWVRFHDGALDYATPFATGGGVFVDMTFGFDASGRMVLYYVENGGRVGRITPTSPPASDARSNLRMVPVTPTRIYDTGDAQTPAIGVAAGDVFNGTTRRVHVDASTPIRQAALVNVTYANNPGVGFVKLWGTRALRPATSSLNADAAGTVAANTAIVPLDQEGSFVLEATMTGRIVVDVLAYFDEAGGAVADGRYVALPPARLADSRIAGGTTLDSGSDNPITRNGDVFTITPAGRVGVPADASAGAVVLSIAAIAGTSIGGFVGAFPTGQTWSGTSNVNVVAGDVRANLVVVPLGSGGQVSLQTTNIVDVAVDVLGYVTGSGAPSSSAGLYSSTDPSRIVDTRTDTGFATLDASGQTIASPINGAAAIVQNLTITQPSAPGFATSYPGGSALPVVSTVNFFPGQTRATLAFTTVGGSGLGYYSLVPTDAVVDVIGYFSG